MVRGNQQWIDWLSEQAIEYEKKDVKTRFAYKKAIASLKACPITYAHPSDAIALIGIGPAIIKFLMKKLAAYCEENGLDMPNEGPAEPKNKAPTKRKATGKLTKAQQKEIEENELDYLKRLKRANALGLSPPVRRDVEERLENGEDEPVAKKPKVARAYTPKYRGGPVAILIGLYLNGSNQNEHDYYSKDEIIKLAAPYSDKPFSEAVAIKTGAGHTVRGYDVWSSKKTLEEHALIESNRKAAKKFKLTEKGLTLTLTHIVEHGIKRENDEEGEEEDFGRREWNAQASGSGEKRNGIKPRNSMEWKPPTSQGDEDAEFLRAMKESETEYKRSMSSNDSVHRNAVASGSGSGGVGGLGRNAAKIATKYIAPPPVKATNSLAENQFLYIYLNSKEEKCFEQDKAAVTVENDGIYYRIEYNTKQDLHPIAKQLYNKQRMIRPNNSTGSKTMSGYLSHNSSSEWAPGLFEPQAAPVAKVAVMGARESLMGNAKRAPPPAQSMYDAPAGVIRSGPDAENARAEASGSNGRKEPNDHGKALVKGKNVVKPIAIPNALPNELIHQPRDLNQHPLYCDPPRPIYGENINFVKEVWQVGTFEIILLIDTREKGAEKVGGTKYKAFEEGLSRLGVRCEVRVLPLGDFVWIARNDEGREVVLDSIVERKRLDDLCTSITDGRYQEQKNRLVQSGFQNLIYLVETFDEAKLLAAWSQQIYTAKSQIQVSSGFALHESTNTKDSINFLYYRDTIMKEIWSTKEIIILPDHKIDRNTYLPLLEKLNSINSNSVQISWTAFQELNKKDAGLSISHQWGRALQCLKGISAEKAAQIVTFWPTGKDFFDDCEKFEREWKRDEERGVKRRKKDVCSDFIVERCDTGKSRDVKAKVAKDLFELFTLEKYT